MGNLFIFKILILFGLKTTKKNYNELLFYIYKNLSWVTESGTIPRIYNGIVRSVVFAIPSSLPEQRGIASALTSVDGLISALDKLISKKHAIKTGTKQELLCGKRRVKGFNEPWVEKRLGDCANILRGSSPRPIESYLTTNPDGINWIKIGDVRPNDKYIRQTVGKIKREGVSHSREVSKGDFILSNSMSFLKTLHS